MVSTMVLVRWRYLPYCIAGQLFFCNWTIWYGLYSDAADWVNGPRQCISDVKALFYHHLPSKYLEQMHTSVDISMSNKKQHGLSTTWPGMMITLMSGHLFWKTAVAKPHFWHCPVSLLWETTCFARPINWHLGSAHKTVFIAWVS